MFASRAPTDTLGSLTAPLLALSLEQFYLEDSMLKTSLVSYDLPCFIHFDNEIWTPYSGGEILM